MADDNTLRSHRSNDPLRRGGQSTAGAGSDPLAELARLIGQSDPFADFGRQPPRSEAHDPQPQQRAPAADWRREAAAMPAYEPLPEEDEEQLRHEQTIRRELPRSERHLAAAPQHGTRYARHDPYQQGPSADEPMDQHYQAAPPQDYYRREPQFADPYEQRHDPYQQHDSYQQQDDAFRMRQDDRIYAPAHEQRAPQQPPFFEDGAPLGPQDDESYDDPPRVRRHGGLLTAVTLIGCAMIGTAGAYGYRTYYVGPAANRTPPTITAEATPDKVVSAGDVQTGKSIQDRVRDPAQGERMVSREEQPVEIRNPGSASSPRVVLPAPVTPSQSMFPPPPAMTQPPAAAQPPAAPAQTGAVPGGGDAKRIRTVTIRPDGNDLNGRPVGGMQQGAPATSRSAPAAKSTPPATRGNGSSPLSLDPQDSASAQPSAPPQRAPQPPAPRTAAVQPNDMATGTTNTAGRAVQVSSQTSEAEAQASLRALQAKYSSQLGGHSSFIKRVDLGAKGVYYRAMIGPFASASEARQFCSDFKSAGGQCLVPTN